MKKIIFTRPDGGLSITTPARNTVGDEGKTDHELEERAWAKLPKDAINPKWINAEDVPKDRTFRNALEDVGGKPVHSLPKAKLLAHGMRRKNRDKEMKPFDDIIAKQIPGEDGIQAEVKRKVIRVKYEATQNAIDMANTIEQLKAEV